MKHFNKKHLSAIILIIIIMILGFGKQFFFVNEELKDEQLLNQKHQECIEQKNQNQPLTAECKAILDNN